jgi:hypothetical protein
MVTNYEGNVTNVNPLTPYPTQALKSSEMIATQTIIDKVPEKLPVYSDTYYLIYANGNDGSRILSGKEELQGILLIRKEIEDNSFFSTYGATGHYNAVNPLTNFSADYFTEIYDCGTVIAVER